MTREEQDRLILEHLELVRILVSRYRNLLPRWIERDELEAAGYLGLVQAAKRYDPSSRAKFSNFASSRILGEMKDYLRQLDHVSRGFRERARRDNLPVPRQMSFADLRLEDESDYEHGGDPAALAYDPEPLDDYVESILSRLRPRERAIILWKFAYGITQREIAKTLGLTEARISSIVQYLRIKRKILAPKRRMRSYRRLK